MRSTHILAAVFVFVGAAFGQMRPPEQEPTPSPVKNVKPAPAIVNARYEGGFFGLSEKEWGTLRFDDSNQRIAFFGEDGKEKFGLPYDAVLMVYPDQNSVTTNTGNVVRHLPLPGAGLAGLIKKKRRYLIIQYDDPDVEAKGTASFKMEGKDILDSVIVAIGSKAKLKPRGEAYIRPRDSQSN